MSNRPLLGKKKMIMKKAVPTKKASALSKKEKAVKDGTAQNAARREEIVRAEMKAERGVLRCTSCGAVFYDKHWHGKNAVKGLLSSAEMVDALCDECPKKVAKIGTAMAGFGGELVIEGVGSDAAKVEIMNAIRAASHRAQTKDPEERVVRIDEQGKKLLVYTTENQLAVGLGKQLHSAMKGGTLMITWSDNDKPVRVHWVMKTAAAKKK